MRGELGDGQVLQQVGAENAGPGSFQQLAAFVAKEGPEIEKIGCLMISKSKHPINVAPAAMKASRLFAGPSTFDNCSLGIVPNSVMPKGVEHVSGIAGNAANNACRIQ